jgi:hypothetical protein
MSSSQRQTHVSEFCGIDAAKRDASQSISIIINHIAAQYDDF